MTTNGFSHAHLTVFLAIWLIFEIVIFAAGREKSSNSQHDANTRRMAATVVLGPLAGALCRDWQGCCTRASLVILPFSAVFLLMGIALQFAPCPLALRLVLWAFGILGWFLGAMLSFLHAFS